MLLRGTLLGSCFGLAACYNPLLRTGSVEHVAGTTVLVLPKQDGHMAGEGWTKSIEPRIELPPRSPVALVSIAASPHAANDLASHAPTPCDRLILDLGDAGALTYPTTYEGGGGGEEVHRAIVPVADLQTIPENASIQLKLCDSSYTFSSNGLRAALAERQR